MYVVYVATFKIQLTSNCCTDGYTIKQLREKELKIPNATS